MVRVSVGSGIGRVAKSLELSSVMKHYKKKEKQWQSNRDG
jgi:hypothetical protein